MNNKIVWLLLALILVGAYLILLLYPPYLFGPFFVDGEIVEDNPILEKKCLINPFCEVVTGVTWPCEQGEYNYTEERLYSWSGFKGCNNLTKGYGEDGYITGIKSCSCRNIIG